MLGDAKDGIDYFMDRNAAVAAARRKMAGDGKPRTVATWPGTKTVWTAPAMPFVETTVVSPNDAEALNERAEAVD